MSAFGARVGVRSVWIGRGREVAPQRKMEVDGGQAKAGDVTRRTLEVA